MKAIWTVELHLGGWCWLGARQTLREARVLAKALQEQNPNWKGSRIRKWKRA